MRLLIIDKTAEGQASCARRIEAFNQADVELLDLRVKLISDREYESQVDEADVVILGAGLGEDAPRLAHAISTRRRELHLLMFLSDAAYSSGAFRTALDAGVRKIFTENSSPLDLLQELTRIHGEFRREGRVRQGRVICVTHAKGGTGATSIAAALGEVCSVYKRRTLLWDLDIESRDLCRSLSVSGPEAEIVSSWVNGTAEINRNSLEAAVVPISEDVSVLMPPSSMAEAMDLVCHTDGLLIAQRVVELARVSHDVLIVDSAGRMGPATGAIMRMADEVLIVIDDTVLGLTALDLYLSYVKALVVGAERISLVVNGFTGSLLAMPQIEAELEPVHNLGSRPWRMPAVPVDAKASLWPGSGKTLYSMGQKSTRAILEEITEELGLIIRGQKSIDPKRSSPWWERLLPRGGTAQSGVV